MTHEQLIHKIEVSVKSEVDNDVRKLREIINSAVGDFMGTRHCMSNSTTFNGRASEVLGQLIKDDPTKGWPGWVWREREEKKLADVLSTMDALQRILVSQDGAVENEEEVGQ